MDQQLHKENAKNVGEAGTPFSEISEMPGACSQTKLCTTAQLHFYFSSSQKKIKKQKHLQCIPVAKTTTQLLTVFY